MVNASELSLVVEVKEKQDRDPFLLQQKAKCDLGKCKDRVYS